MHDSSSQKNDVALKFVNCSLAFKNKKIFSNVNLTINVGQRVAIIGKNGSGKTSLIESIVNPKRGFSGEIIQKPQMQTAFIFQKLTYLGAIGEVFKLFSYILKIPNKMNEWFKYFGLKKSYRAWFQYFSGGEKQKTKLILAFLKQPDLVIIDEMTTSLDYLSRLKIIQDVKKILKKYPKITLVMISHDEHEISELCDHYAVLKDGHLGEKQPFRTEKKLAHTIEVLESL